MTPAEIKLNAAGLRLQELAALKELAFGEPVLEDMIAVEINKVQRELEQMGVEEQFILGMIRV